MTEKRFYISSDNNQNVYDTVLKCYYSSVDAQKLCDLLNELSDNYAEQRKENYGLLDGIAFYKEENASLSERISDLECENEQLKADNNRLVNETAKVVAEHQSKVFKLIDNKINEYIYKEKLYKHKGKDREASVFNLYCLCLNNLKKELSE